MVVQPSMPGLYLPPVLKYVGDASPPHTIISLPVQTAVWSYRAVGALAVLVAGQLSVPGLYLPPVLKKLPNQLSSPDDHFTPGPDCSGTKSARGRIGQAGGCPTIRAGIVSPARVQNEDAINSAPDDHFTARPHRSMQGSGICRVGRAGRCPTVGAGIVSPPVLTKPPLLSVPPQTIISLPVHTAV